MAFTLSATTSFALPRCEGSPLDFSKYTANAASLVKSWNRCIGKVTHYSGSYYHGAFKSGQWSGQGTYWVRSNQFYKGNWVNGLRDGFGVQTQAVHPKVRRGIWKQNKFVKAQATIEISPLRANFTKLSKEQRKQVQLVLLNLGFYKFSIDGLYGKGTAAALTAYNKQNLTGADLSKSANVSKLISTVLSLTPTPTPKPKVIQTDKPEKTLEVASGTGFYVSNEGHIITNHHVIDGCMDMKVHTKGRILPTLRIADDKQNDLALLKISETPSYVFALSNSSPYPLQEIIVAGFPFGDRYSSTLKFTKGIVSSLAGMGDNYSEIQIDAALQQGNSGGPIIDEYGNVVAVAVAKLDAKYMFDNFGIIPENTNFGIKASAVRNLLEGNQVPLKIPSTDVISKRDLSRLATDGTVYLTCWMTNAQLEQMKSKKVMFENFN